MTVKWLAGMLNPEVRIVLMRDGERVHAEKARELVNSTFGECRVDTFEMSSNAPLCLVDLGVLE